MEKKEIREIKDRVYFIAARLFGRPLSPGDLPKTQEIAADFEDFVLGTDKPANKRPA
jgi:hypothetical protein